MTTDLQPAPKADRLIAHDDGPTAYLFDSARFEQMKRVAIAMAHASLIPDHLHGDSQDESRRWEQTVGNCLLIVNQAIRWRLDPFVVAQSTYVVRGKLGYEGKLVAAVVHGLGNLKGRLGYSFHGEGHGRTITVAGQFLDEAEPRTITLSVGQAKTDNKMWVTDPDQKLVYSGVTKWARRHCPELMLGVLTLDDLDRMATSRMDGSAVADHAEQARQLRESKEAVAETRPLDGLSVSLDDPDVPVDSDAPQAATEAALPRHPGAPIYVVEEAQAPQTAAEEPEPVNEMDLEVSYLKSIEQQTMIRPVNTISNSLSTDPDLTAEAITRLQTACEHQRKYIRTKRGTGTAPDGTKENLPWQATGSR